MFQVDLTELLRTIKAEWHQPRTIIIILIILLIILLWLFTKIDLKKISWLEFFFLSLVPILILSGWVYSRRVPKIPRGQVGFGVAITVDVKEQRERIAKDFVATVRELLFQSNLRYRFAFIEFPPHHAAKIKTADDAREYLRMSRCHFMIFGRARVRQIEGKEHHVLNMEGIVRHHPIPQEVSKHLSVEFTEIFPRRLLLSSENDLFLFEFSSEWVNLVARYVIGIASLFSGDLAYSQSLFEDLDQRVNQVQTNLPAITKIRQRLPTRLTDVYLAHVRFAHEEWRQTRNQDCLDRAKSYLDRMKPIAPNHYEAHLLRSIWHFAANRDIARAKTEIRRCQKLGIKDATWRYSYAFLFAYSGDMKKAVRMYQTAFRHDCSDTVPFEIEEFICWVLEEEPEKIQLHFCLGLINNFAKGDKARALQDFERFIDTVPEEQFQEEKRLAQNYMEDIRRQIRTAA